MRRPAWILHGPWNAAGNPVGLSRGERELGFVSDVAVLQGDRYGYEADIDLAVGARLDRAAKLKKSIFMARAIRRYDVFHYNVGKAFFHTLDREGRIRTELPLLKRLGKTILATFQGDDARPRSANPFAPNDPASLESDPAFQAKQRELMTRYADRVFFVNPDLRRWLPGAEFRPYASVNPFAIEPLPIPGGDELVVAHAPSDRKIKGTDRLIEVVASLRADGVPIRLDLIEGVSNEEVMGRLGAAHLAVDQLNVGWYGGFAVEAMASGRPVLCYIREDEPEDNPFGDELPIIRTGPERLADDLRRVAAERERLPEFGAKSRAFVERVHDPREVARANLTGLVPIPVDARSAD